MLLVTDLGCLLQFIGTLYLRAALVLQRTLLVFVVSPIRWRKSPLRLRALLLLCDATLQRDDCLCCSLTLSTLPACVVTVNA